jgi:hypothetical protein
MSSGFELLLANGTIVYRECVVASDRFQSTAKAALAHRPRTKLLPHRNVVLVVDDDPAMLRSVARRLRQFGYASLLFPSAEASQGTVISTGRFASSSTSTWVMGQGSI